MNQPSQKTDSHCSTHTKPISIQYGDALNSPKNNSVSCHLLYHLSHPCSLRGENVSEPCVFDHRQFLEQPSES